MWFKVEWAVGKYEPAFGMWLSVDPTCLIVAPLYYQARPLPDTEGDSVGFEVEYSHQGDAHLSCERVTTIIDFICDASAKVPHVTGSLICSQSDDLTIMSIAGMQDDCMWHLRFQAGLVCEAAGASAGAPALA